MAVMVAHARDPVVPPSRIREGIPADLEQVVLRCLEKNPDRRYQNAEGLGQALSACQAASSWTAKLAEAWWQASEPQVCQGGDHPSSPRPVPEAIDLTRKDDTNLTLAASEVEAVLEPDSALETDLSVSVIEDDVRPERSR
jgi:serine/threonine-protein kinase